MITAGIDSGAKNTRTVIIRDGDIIGRGEALTGFNQSVAVKNSLDMAMKECRLCESEINYVGATGAGMKSVSQADLMVNEARAMSAVSHHFFPTSSLVIDVGAEEARVARFDERGAVEDYVINERCAAGAGSFIEAMARALETPLNEMGELALASNKSIPMNAQCAIFAESEVVGLIHAKVAKMDIVRAIHDAIVSRIVSMVRRVGLRPDIVLIGGLARNRGFVSALERELGIEKVLIPEEPEYGAATGAALLMMAKVKNL